MDRIIETEYDRKQLDEFFAVPGFEGRYEFSKSGQVRSLDRYVNSPIAGGSRLIRGKMMTLNVVKGYPAFSAMKHGKKVTIYIHRLIAERFVPNPSGKPHVNHIDGDKANFDPSNLEWCTHQENMAHAFSMGLARPPEQGKAEKCAAAKLNWEKAREIKDRISRGEPHKSIALSYGVSPSTISGIKAGVVWSSEHG